VQTVAGPIVLTRVQTLALLFIVVVAFTSIAALQQRQSNRIEQQQKAILANSHQLDVQRYNSCVAGVAYIQTFNKAWHDLADVERTQKIDPALSRRRVAVYQSLTYSPVPTVAQCGPRP
jgi:hypothetical protein